ncbi:MAG: hypothetical protein WC897_00105 [Candidatus Gracilibacteria bacterium]
MGPVYIYHNTVTNECGSLWIGDEFNEYTPASLDWKNVGILGSDSAQSFCQNAGYTYTEVVPSKETALMLEDGTDVQTASFVYALLIVAGMLVLSKLFHFR